MFSVVAEDLSLQNLFRWTVILRAVLMNFLPSYKFLEKKTQINSRYDKLPLFTDMQESMSVLYLRMVLQVISYFKLDWTKSWICVSRSLKFGERDFKIISLILFPSCYCFLISLSKIMLYLSNLSGCKYGTMKVEFLLCKKPVHMWK